MALKVAINGFGRIGRNAFKVAFERKDIEIVALNDLTDNPTLAHLLKYDTAYGRYAHDVEASENGIVVDGHEIKVLNEPDPEKLPWGDMNVDVVIESTGRFVKTEDAKKHVTAGAKRVVISAPAKSEGSSTYVLGVNDDKLVDDDNQVFSNGSCTTNCIVPPAAVMEANFGVEKAMMTTIHSYTADQRLQDAPHGDMRRARAAAQNIIPTSTGAAIATGEVLENYKGIFDGMAFRVPTMVGSVSDFTFLLKRDVTVEEVNSAFKEAAAMPIYQGILAVTEEPLVSSDFVGDSHSSTVDLSHTKVVGGNMVKVVAWYDNEWGYSNRLVELVADIGKVLA
ncbi:TPA: type I glyceraldehyde-3-phosphate dehydrogenase [Candidatus Saccharibacteria bacterium]|nr:type I glyceraldehyde-3-phosphate dehydrogenase [Candidatus Saccharibacteria bacterium]HIO87462.1 type I glyceraldehyde-3-phosphate dehydrogenase [Candidatus Saccharibacteria bacterium]